MSQETGNTANDREGEVIDNIQPEGGTNGHDEVQDEQQESHHMEHFEPLQPADSEITFHKRTVPKQRTQSVQSVLSSVSLRSFVHQKPQQQAQQQQQQSQQQQQNQGTQPQFISAKTHIQAPATAASSKRRASFEIGQRLPFHKDNEATENGASDEAIDSEELEPQQEQRKLTDDALKRLSSFSNKFTPAEVDITMSTKKVDEEDVQNALKEPKKIDTNIPFRSQSASQINNMRPLSAQSSRVLSRNMSNLSPVAHSDVDEEQALTNSGTIRNPNDYIGNEGTPSKMHIKLPQHIDPGQPMVPTPSSNSSIDNSNLKTINDPKRPMYVPAVLRQSNTNLKPEDVRHINEQNSRKSKSILHEAANSLRTQSSHWSLRFEGSSGKSPTRAHWRRDLTRHSCALCDKNFTFFERRHHCRRCGDIFCAEHTSHLLKLGLDAQFTLGGQGLLCKVCDNCCRDYEQFVKRELGETGATGGRKSSIVTEDQQKQNSGDANAMVGTVPADWSWSSF